MTRDTHSKHVRRAANGMTMQAVKHVMPAIRTDPKRGTMRACWRVTLECGHVVERWEAPKMMARCEVCSAPDVRPCRECGAGNPRSMIKGVCKRCRIGRVRDQESAHARAARTPGHDWLAKNVDLLAPLNELVRATPPCGPREFWR